MKKDHWKGAMSQEQINWAYNYLSSKGAFYLLYGNMQPPPQHSFNSNEVCHLFKELQKTFEGRSYLSNLKNAWRQKKRGKKVLIEVNHITSTKINQLTTLINSDLKLNLSRRESLEIIILKRIDPFLQEIKKAKKQKMDIMAKKKINTLKLENINLKNELNTLKEHLESVKRTV